MDTFEAIADPVRRAIMEALWNSPLTAGDTAALFPISRPAISRHLRVLREAGLVTVESTGRERIYRLSTAPLTEVERWTQQFQERWESRFDALETEAHRTRRERERRDQPTRTDPPATRKESA